MSDALWNHEAPIRELGIDVPAWIDQDINGADVAAIVQGGCASGAYMPAVTYHQALATMNEHGDDVLEYLEDTLGEIPQPSEDTPHTWSGMACFFVSAAVELWASSVEDEAITALEDADEEA